jgi:hypothetical protein
MNEIGLEELRKHVRQELQKWHNPKDGRTMQKIYAETGLATSNLRKILRGEANPSFTTCYRLLTAICPKESVYSLIDELFTDARTRNLAATKPSGLRIDSSDDAWFVIKISTAETMSVDFASTFLGANYNVVMEKFINSGYVSIDNGMIYASNTHNELLDEGSVRNLGRFVLDSAYTTKDSDMMACRVFRTTAEKAKRGRTIMMNANKDLSDLFKEETEKPSSCEEPADFAFVLACAIV